MSIRFSIEGNPEYRTHEAVRIARRWNGWAVPVVTRETMLAVLKGLDEDEAGNAPEYRTAWVELTDGRFMVELPDSDGPDMLSPDADGLFTFDLGWVWDTIED